jgi:2,4'-dihydroxyacetophenone dioxygenase
MSAIEPGVVHIPADDRAFPWADFPGGRLRLLRADLGTGEWVVHNQFEPGFTADKHRHTGHVDAFTIRGRWRYLEYGIDYGPGSYVYEPTNSVHQLHVPDDLDGICEVIFVMRGANLNLGADGSVTSVTDGAGTLAAYHMLCEMQGLGTPTIHE